MACLRFETSKRRLQYLTFSALRRCADSIMQSWTYTPTTAEYLETEMDREFLLDLRELRILLDKEKEHKQYEYIFFAKVFVLLFYKYFLFLVWCVPC